MPRDIGNEIVVAIAAIGILAFAFVFAIVLSISNIPDAEQTATANANIQPTSTEILLLVSPSATALPPSATPLPVISQQPASPRPVTSTSSPTPTKQPSATPTAALTATHTPTPSNTPAITATFSEEMGILPTPTGILSPTTVTTIPEGCTPPTSWVLYTVQPGDTLFSIARNAGSSVVRLQTANCLGNVNSIFAGTPLYVPRMPAGVTPILPPSLPYPGTGQTGVIAAQGCTHAGARITNLQAGQTVSGVITLMGTADVSDFWYYKIEVRPNFATVYNFYSRSETPVEQGTLGLLDTKRFDSELYWIRLTVLANSSESIPTCTIPVFINNP